jgi:hypothetical protein
MADNIKVCDTCKTEKFIPNGRLCALCWVKLNDNNAEATETQAGLPVDSQVNGYAFEPVAKRCPWRIDCNGWFGCAAMCVEAGLTYKNCEEENCGLIYILNIIKPLNA